MNTHNKQSKNINLLFAQDLLKMQEPDSVPEEKLAWHTLRPSIFKAFTIDEIRDCFNALKRRYIIRFENDEDLFYLHLDEPITFHPSRKLLKKFIKTASDPLFGLDINNRKEIIKIIKVLDSLISAPTDENNQIKINDLKEANKDLLEYIADYSGYIKIIYELEADFDYIDGKYRPVSAGEFPKIVTILDIVKLKELNIKIKNKLKSDFLKPIELFLNNYKEATWRCAKCSRFLDKLSTKEQIENYLVDFMIGKYKICHKCRKRNYFEIESKGRINFLMLQKDDNDSN